MRRPPSVLAVIGSVVGAIGFVLLVLEVARTLNGQPLGGLGTGLLWAGFALLGVGLLVLVVSLTTDEGTDAQPGAAATAPPAPAPSRATRPRKRAAPSTPPADDDETAVPS